MDFINLINKFFPLDPSGKINIFGFKLQIDDLLIIALLFFFYKERVSNKLLYLILISLIL